MNARQIFLLVSAGGLTPIALSYGLMPGESLDYLLQISVTDTNSTHIFRAVMGLYLGFAAFWLSGVFKTEVRQSAIYSVTVFMLGLAGGRTLSIVLDGIPSTLLWVYLILELAFGFVGLAMLRRGDS